MPTLVVLAAVTTAGYFDLRWRRVPNWLVLGTLVLAIPWHVAATGWPGLRDSGAGLVLGILALFPLFALRGMGAGDVKFFGALGAAVTHRHLLPILATSFVLAAGIAVYQIVRQGVWRKTMANTVDLLTGLLKGRWRPHPVARIDRKGALLVPFTFAVAVATWIFFLIGSLEA